MNEKEITETFPNEVKQNINSPVTNRSLEEYQSVFTKNLPKKTKNAVMCVFISVGKAHCSDAQFQSLLKLLNKTFTDSHVIFIIADTLQRFTYQLHGISAEESEKKASQEGLAWKAQHLAIIQNTLNHLTYDFVHWLQLTSENESYLNDAKSVDIAYQEDESFRRKFDKTVTGFLSAQLGDKNVTHVVDKNLGTQLCLDYLKEECSAHLVIAHQKCTDIKLPSYTEKGKVDYAIYPRSMSDAFEATYQKFIPLDVLVYLPVRNKFLKQETLLHEPSVKKPIIFSSKNTDFFKQSYSKQKEISSLASKELVEQNTAFKTYFSCLKTILNSENIPIEAKLQLVKEIIENSEKTFVGESYNPPSLTL